MKERIDTIKQHFDLIKRIICGPLGFVQRTVSQTETLTRRYRNRVFDRFVKMILAAISIYFLFVLLFYVCQMLWHLYLSTPTGKHFLTTHSIESAFFSSLFNLDGVALIRLIVLTSLKNSCLIGIVCQFFQLMRYFYDSRGVIGKFVIWGGGLSYLAAWQISVSLEIDWFGGVFLISALPTLCLFTFCFDFTRELVPEIGEIFNKNNLKLSIEWVKLRLKKIFPD